MLELSCLCVGYPGAFPQHAGQRVAAAEVEFMERRPVGGGSRLVHPRCGAVGAALRGHPQTEGAAGRARQTQGLTGIPARDHNHTELAAAFKIQNDNHTDSHRELVAAFKIQNDNHTELVAAFKIQNDNHTELVAAFKIQNDNHTELVAAFKIQNDNHTELVAAFKIQNDNHTELVAAFKIQNDNHTELVAACQNTE